MTLINNRIHLESEIHGDDILPTDISKVSYDIILSDEEIDYYFNEMYTKFKDTLIYYHNNLPPLIIISYNLLYLVLTPLAFSTGYFFSYISILSKIICLGSTPI